MNKRLHQELLSAHYIKNLVLNNFQAFYLKILKNLKMHNVSQMHK